jgi:hypothetical protein
MINHARIAFGRAALSTFTQIIEDVTVDLVGDGLAAKLVRSDEMRRKLAQKVARLRAPLVDRYSN